jgi:hypothetical protein
MVAEPWMTSQNGRTAPSDVMNFGDLHPSKNPMMRPTDVSPRTAFQCNFAKQTPKNENVANAHTLVPQMRLGGADLAERTLPSGWPGADHRTVYVGIKVTWMLQ